MTNLMDRVVGLVVGSIGLLIVAGVLATITVANVGSLAFTVISYINVAIAVGLLIYAFQSITKS